jgi:mannose-1-phosphate guanylyltransferase
MPLLAGLEPRQILEQPCNRGTAPAIFYGIRRLLELDRDATVAIFPSDHFVGNDQAFMGQVESAFNAVDAFPQLCVVMGIRPRTAETSYGWIEPAGKISLDHPELFRVKRFREKPDAKLARRLFQNGCLWNSFILVASVKVLYSMVAEFAPDLFCTFNAELAESGPGAQASAIDRIYNKLATQGFSDLVLAQCPPNLAVLRMDHPQWSDLGEPARVLEAVSSMDLRPRWLEAFVSGTGKTLCPEA